MKTVLLALGLVFAAGVAMISAVDYFADGCIVNGRALVTVRPGVQVWSQGEMCRQYIVHTERGRQRDTGGKTVF